MSNFKQIHNSAQNVHFAQALFGECERSSMSAAPIHITTFNAGDIVPIYCREILPTESVKMDLDFVIRQTTLLTPTMGNMDVDIYAFFVPNRIVNQSWKVVEGENLSGSWTAPQVSLAPLVTTTSGSVQVPVGSVADYYGFPTQMPIPDSVLAKCHDLKFRGYVMIYNEFFRDQNYQPPIPMSTLNIFQGFFASGGIITINGSPGANVTIGNSSDGSFGGGSVNNALYGSGSFSTTPSVINAASSTNRFRALSKPLKANKHHDYFTSVLPSPQKSSSPVFAPVSGSVITSGLAPVFPSASTITPSSLYPGMRWHSRSSVTPAGSRNIQADFPGTSTSGESYVGSVAVTPSTPTVSVYPANLWVDLSNADTNVTGLAISVDDIRMASAIQQVYETLARGGSRYRELVRSFFGIEADDPYSDIPQCLGHISRSLDLYQTAQTSGSVENGTPQGNLAAFGYTSTGGTLFNHTFLEHGYLHIFAVVRHRNLYSSYLARDNFRLNMMDFYMPQLANISEQPVYTYEINPFAPNPTGAFGYQEAWSEYRFEPDIVSGEMRTVPVSGPDSLSVWNYADNFDSSLQISNGEWLKSNSEEVLNRTLAVTSALAPQFKAMFKFVVYKELPMPTYSVPGMDII